MPYKDLEARRAYGRDHYSANKPVYKARAVVHSTAEKAAVQAFLRDYLADHPCIDCGEADPIVLEFDHRDGVEKRFHLGAAGTRKMSLRSVQAEVAKCDVRCANCHRRKTYRERGLRHRG